jgi:hypothetical protein
MYAKSLMEGVEAMANDAASTLDPRSCENCAHVDVSRSPDAATEEPCRGCDVETHSNWEAGG